MITTKKNVIVYTIEIDNEKLDCHCFNSFELINLFKKNLKKRAWIKKPPERTKAVSPTNRWQKTDTIRHLKFPSLLERNLFKEAGTVTFRELSFAPACTCQSSSVS